MQRLEWNRFSQWHILLDELCECRGYIDNAKLASQLCRRSGKSAQEDFNAAEKNLRNWRLGRHLPLRRNFMILAELLGVSDDPELLRQWNLLYSAARGRDVPDRRQIADEAEIVRQANHRPARRLLWAGAITLTAVLAVTGFRWMASDPYADLPMIGYDARVRMLVGESRLIHGDRGDCDGGNVPGWGYTMPRVPFSTLGTFSDGGLARKMSNFCNAVVPVRAVRFTARKAGVEEVRLLDDFVKIFVTDPAHLVQ
ncbi:hypothetical protein [Aquamicrobium ahrensii]|uniref:Transcriptional regulator n=1 Tax=Aquamicrobium ahrensii TaxID=469551 RepID=A0ABV2KI56_9HYPH